MSVNISYTSEHGHTTASDSGMMDATADSTAATGHAGGINPFHPSELAQIGDILALHAANARAREAANLLMRQESGSQGSQESGR